MKIVSEKQLARSRRVTIELNNDEEIFVIRQNAFYKLGGQINDVVAAHALAEAVQVTWCSIEQRWVE